jgi:hypothetical protein
MAHTSGMYERTADRIINQKGCLCWGVEVWSLQLEHQIAGSASSAESSTCLASCQSVVVKGDGWESGIAIGTSAESKGVASEELEGVVRIQG